MTGDADNANVFQRLTAGGPAAVAVVRVRGEDVEAFLAKHVKTRATLTHASVSPGLVARGDLVEHDGTPIDDILVSVHATSPMLDVRLHLHGSRWLVSRCEALLVDSGFTAEDASTVHVWESDDPLVDEAHALLPKMMTIEGTHWLLKQPTLLRGAIEELLRASDWEHSRQICEKILRRFEIVKWFSQPTRVALVGPPNVGKSTLANALVDRTVSIVSERAGTTRDWIEAPGDADGFPVVWLDTAGLRDGTDHLERLGIQRAKGVLETADATVLVVDAADYAKDPRIVGRLADEIGTDLTLVAVNKCDSVAVSAEADAGVVFVSALTGEGISQVGSMLMAALGLASCRMAQPAGYTRRQVALLTRAAQAGNREAFRSFLSEIVKKPTS